MDNQTIENIRLDEKKLPTIITEQFEKLHELDESIKNALMLADSAYSVAIESKEKSTGLFKKKAAIEGLQESGVQLAEAVQSNAEAQRISFEFQTKLAEISKYLFGLGVKNIVTNRVVVREIEMRLRGASQEELSELARNELYSVVRQLKEQEDLLHKQEVMNKVVQGHDTKIKKQEEVDKLHAKQIRLQEETDRVLAQQIKAQEEVDQLHAKQIRLQEETDKMLAEKIEAQDKVDQLHAEQIRLQEETDQYHTEQIQLQAETDRLHEARLGTLEERVQTLEEEILNLRNELKKKAENKIMLVSIAMAIGAVALAVIL